jgi:nucleoside-diphosphate-sugar epimerase
MQRVLVTGAAGKVAGLLIPYLQNEYELIFTDARKPKTALEPFTQAQLQDYDALLELCQGVDTVLHLGVMDYFVDWQLQIPSNIIGVQHVLLAAKAAKCRRVILASSVQVIWGHSHPLILESDAPCPTNFYGATKAFAEALARVHSQDQSLSVICVRLGAVLSKNDVRLQPYDQQLKISITERDLAQLMRLCLQTKQHFAVVHGVSDNQNNPFSLKATKALLGYQPKDDVVVLAAKNWVGGLKWWGRRVKNYLKKRFFR